MVKKEKVKLLLATGWLSPKGKFEEVRRGDLETWASSHLINDLNDLTYYGHDLEKQLQIAHNYIKFEDGVLMSVVWRTPNRLWTTAQEKWMEKNWERIDPYSHKFIKEISLLKILKEIKTA